VTWLMNYEVFIWHDWILFKRIQVRWFSIWSVPCVLSYSLLRWCGWPCSLHCWPFASVHRYYSWSGLCWWSVWPQGTDTTLGMFYLVTTWSLKASTPIGIYMVLLYVLFCHWILSNPPYWWFNFLCIASIQSPGLVPVICSWILK
jgi:hypothetical protein